MDELGFYVPSTVFQSFRDDGSCEHERLCAMKRRFMTDWDFPLRILATALHSRMQRIYETSSTDGP